MPQEGNGLALVHEDADVTGRFTEGKRPIQCFEGGGMVAFALVRQRLEHQNSTRSPVRPFAVAPSAIASRTHARPGLSSAIRSRTNVRCSYIRSYIGGR